MFKFRDEAMDAHPSGIISEETFCFRGAMWRLLSRRSGGPKAPLKYIAVLDGGSMSPQDQERKLVSSNVHSRPLSDVDMQQDVYDSSGVAACGRLDMISSRLAFHDNRQAASGPSLQGRFVEDIVSAESSLSAMER